MAIEFASSSRAEVTQAVATARPITIAGWMHADSGSTGYVASICDASGSNLMGLVILGGSTECGAAESRNGSFNTSSLASFTTGSWQHAAAIFTGTNTRQAYLNGSAATAVTQGSAATSLDRTLLRTRAGFTTTDDGIRLAEIGIWQAALTSDEITRLAAGFSPLALRHRLGDLVFYQPLYREIGHTIVGPAQSMVGTANAFVHPRIVPGAAFRLSPTMYVSTADPYHTAAASLFVTGAEVGQTYIAGAEVGMVASL